MNLEGVKVVFKEIEKEVKREIPDLSEISDKIFTKEERPDWGDMDVPIPILDEISDNPMDIDPKYNTSEQMANGGAEADSADGKTDFYAKVYDDLSSSGKVIEEKDIRGTKSVSPPDAVLERDNEIIAIEIKSPREMQSDSIPGRGGLKTDYVGEERAEANRRGDLPKDHPEYLPKSVGKHEVFMAQAEHYADKIEDGTVTPRENSRAWEGKEVRVGYSVPASESTNVEKAFADRGIEIKEKLDGPNGSVTYIYDLPEK